MRIKRSVNALKKRRAILKQAKGYWGARSNYIALQNKQLQNLEDMLMLEESKENVNSAHYG